ncbi:MAG: hypothetical protein QQW96_02280 [Tychonema bourrellyi B0820]|nr:hypothetical protein [Tychonema bourrellyi B0820]
MDVEGRKKEEGRRKKEEGPSTPLAQALQEEGRSYFFSMLNS